MEQPRYINKKEFANLLGMTKSTFCRRAQQIGCVLPPGLLSIEYREIFIQKLSKWESNRLEEQIKYANGAK